VKDDTANVWGGVGNAAVSERYVGELEGAKGQSDIDTDLAHCSIVFDVVCMEGTKCTLFWRLWDWFDEIEEDDATYVVYVEREILVYLWGFLFWIYR
jgi:hypothetical protein